MIARTWRVRCHFGPNSTDIEGKDPKEAAEQFVEELIDDGEIDLHVNSILVIVENPRTFETVQVKVSIGWKSWVSGKIVNPAPDSEQPVTVPSKIATGF